jgi:hypothetical protein
MKAKAEKTNRRRKYRTNEKQVFDITFRVVACLERRCGIFPRNSGE